MDEELEALRHLGWPFPAALYLHQVALAQVSIGQRFRQQVRGGNSVLDRQVDADAADRRHGVGGIANAQQAGPAPLLQAIDLDCQQVDVLPAPQIAQRLFEGRYKTGDAAAKFLEAGLLDFFKGPLCDHISTLPIVTAIDLDEDLTGAEAPQGLPASVGATIELEPQHIHGRPKVVNREPRLGPYNGATAVRRHG